MRHLYCRCDAADHVPALRPHGVQLLAGAGDHGQELGQRPSGDGGVRHHRLLRNLVQILLLCSFYSSRVLLPAWALSLAKIIGKVQKYKVQRRKDKNSR